MNKNKPNTNPKQRIKMLIRRIRTQKRIITSLEERNYHLVTELNETKVALGNTTNEYNKLMAKNYEQAVTLNHIQDERVKLKATMDELDVEALSALKSLGTVSEVLLNLKKNISYIKSGISEYKPEETIVLPSSPFSSRNEVSLSDSVEVKRNQAAVSPMVKGYVISNPTITLERLRLNDIGGVIEPGKSIDARDILSPIPEETAESEPIRTRLGRRGQLPQHFTGRAASKLSEFIPEAHAEPVVRLSDVSRLLSNTSWLNYTPPKDNTNTSSSTSAPSVSGINVFPTDTITLRERKKGKRANKVSGIDKIESSTVSSENLKTKDPKSRIRGAENNEDKSIRVEYKNSKVESLEPKKNEENTIRFVNSGILAEDSESSESRNSTLCSFSEINEVNSKYKNSRKRSNKDIAESSFSINDEGTSNKNSSFEESKFTTNASVTVNEIEESVKGRETIIQINKNSNEENFSKCEKSIVCSAIESTSKYDTNVLSDKENDEKMSICNIEASAEKIEENANIDNNELAMSKFTNSKNLEDTGNPDVANFTTNKKETSDEQSPESRGTFLLAKEINSGNNRTFIVRNSNAPVSQENSVINCTRVLPELGIAASNETEKENTVIEQSIMNPTTSVKSSLTEVRELKRPRSTRIKKPSIKVLEAVSGDINEESFQVKRKLNRANRTFQKNSKCLAESDAKSTNSVDSGTSEVGVTQKRTSSRIKKSVVYRDEPLTEQEMKKILQKGLSKAR